MKRLRWRWSACLARVEVGSVVVMLAAAIVVIPWYNIQWPKGGLLGGVILLILGLLLSGALIRFVAPRLTVPGCILGKATSCAGLLVFGVVLQVCVTLILHPEPVSDSLVYLDLAEKLASGAAYQEQNGFKAFWPPGMPLFLTPFVWCLGPGLAAVAAANAVLLVCGGIAIYYLGVFLFNPYVATGALLLFMLWPSRLLTATVPAKENLTIAAVLVCICFLMLSTRRAGTARAAYASAGGASLGIGVLAQPGLLLLALTAPLAFRGHIARFRGAEILRWIASLSLGIVVCVTPWVLRNWVVFDGKFLGVSTNGGSVLYRANNSKATGIWIAEGEVPLGGLPELEQNALGLRLAQEWIAAHPAEMLSLSAKKLVHFIGSDDTGSYLAVFRGAGLSDAAAHEENSQARRHAYLILDFVSLAFWAALCAVVARNLFQLARDGGESGVGILPLVYPLLYSVVVFSIFESGSRQHMAAVGPLIIVAACNCQRIKTGLVRS